MLRIFLTIALLSGSLLASTKYTVRLAVYKNSSKLSKEINKYPPALKKTVKTYQKENVNYAYTMPTEDKETLKKLLPAYQKVFKDAYIQSTNLQ